MSVNDMISPGIGFTPGSVEFIVTRGLIAGAALVVNVDPEKGTFRTFTDKRSMADFYEKRAFVIRKEKRGNK